jgi:hypothetical protein
MTQYDADAQNTHTHSPPVNTRSLNKLIKNKVNDSAPSLDER